MVISRHSDHLVGWLLLLGLLLASVTQASLAPFLPQSFFFDYNKPSEPVPVPVTRQCENIHIQWSRGAASGPNPQAPYYLQVYTSAFQFPFIIPAGSGLDFDWEVPFAPGTLYQICMFDGLGNTGGCQATYSMISSNSTPVCNNVTFPQGPLSVDSVVDNGPMSIYGWIDQCTDLSVTPKSGTPPFTLTIAPALHPPYNITSSDMTSMNWTVSLSWASLFFVSVADSAGNFWSAGPLHSGGGGTTACLAGLSSTAKLSRNVRPSIAIGSGLGGLGLGLLAGAVSMFFALRHVYKKRIEEYEIIKDQGIISQGAYGGVLSLSSRYPSTSPLSGPNDASRYSSLSTNPLAPTLGNTQIHVEPFVYPVTEDEPRRPVSTVAEGPESGEANSMSQGDSSKRRGGQIYVVHHDSGTAPVTVYHGDGTQVVELPPRYPPSSNAEVSHGTGGVLKSPTSQSDNPSEGERPSSSDFFEQPRRPNHSQKPSTGSSRTYTVVSQ